MQKYKMIVAVKAGEMIDKSKNQLDRNGVEGGHWNQNMEYSTGSEF